MSEKVLPAFNASDMVVFGPLKHETSSMKIGETARWLAVSIFKGARGMVGMTLIGRIRTLAEACRTRKISVDASHTVHLALTYDRNI